MADILEDLADLYKQATTERSHYYTARVIDEAIDEIKRLRSQVKKYQDKEAAIVRLWNDPASQ